MQLKFFTYSILEVSKEEEQINKFLRSVKVLEIKRELISENGITYWAMCILYLENNRDIVETMVKQKVDYKELLTESQFKEFCLLRKIRKQLADEDAVPAFAIFTDYELSEISKLDHISISSIKQVKGIGDKKIEKYGQKFCEMVKVNINEKKE